jgi:hypothetical protein
MREFVGIDLGREPVPDETTICKLRSDTSCMKSDATNCSWLNWGEILCDYYPRQMIDYEKHIVFLDRIGALARGSVNIALSRKESDQLWEVQ